jgi:hypothetical protein
MLWLVAQVWVWMLVALLLGLLAGWLFWARPVQRAARRARGAGPGRTGGR